jgi:hypothetical protein
LDEINNALGYHDSTDRTNLACYCIDEAMVTKLQRVLKDHFNHPAIEARVYFLECAQELVAKIVAIWLWLDVTAYVSNFSGYLSVSVYRIFQKFVKLFNFGGKSKNLPGHLFFVLNIRAEVSNQILDRKRWTQIVYERKVAAVS